MYDYERKSPLKLRPVSLVTEAEGAREARTIGETAQAAVLQADQLKREVEAVIATSRKVANDLETEGLALIEEMQTRQATFNDQCQQFFADTTDLHVGLRDMLQKIGKPTSEKPAAGNAAERADEPAANG